MLFSLIVIVYPDQDYIATIILKNILISVLLDLTDRAAGALPNMRRPHDSALPHMRSQMILALSSKDGALRAVI